jgi:hypothetical protein
MRFFSIIFYSLASLPILLSLDSFKNLPWDFSQSFETNIEPYVKALISIAVFIQMRRVLEPMVKASGGYLECTELVRGSVRSIGYSDTRINNSPRFKALVFYSGIEKEFDLLPEAFQFNFKIGDEVVIRHHPDDESNSTLDFELSLAKKSESKQPN